MDLPGGLAAGAFAATGLAAGGLGVGAAGGGWSGECAVIRRYFASLMVVEALLKGHFATGLTMVRTSRTSLA